MEPERYAVVRDHFVAILEMKPAEREQYIDGLRIEDPSLADDVGLLLKSDDDAADADFLEECVPGYSRLEPISRGGQGTVYRAVQNRTGQRVAIKIIASRDLEAGDRFQQAIDDFAREIETVATLRHRNIVRIFDAGKCSAGQFFVMELVEGGTLAEFQHQLNQHQAGQYLQSIAEAVHEAHASGILHLDIKPQNILFDDHLKQPFLVDFGLARLVEADQHAGRIAGTLQFMAPEQIEGGEVDERTDVYGLGATLFYLLTGRPVRQVSTIIEARDQLSDAPDDVPAFEMPEVNSELVRICHRCLHPDPQRRYQTARELSEDLIRLRETEDVQHIYRGGDLTLKCSGLFFLINVIIYGLVRTGVPEQTVAGELVTWAIIFSMYAVVFAIFHYAPLELDAVDSRQTMESLWSIWISKMLAAMVISIGLRLGPAQSATEAILLSCPIFGALTGMVFCIMAPRLWRSFYLLAAAAWLMSIVIMVTLAFQLQIAPLIYGAGTSLGAAVWGLQLRKVARELQAPIDQPQSGMDAAETPTVIASKT